MRSGSMRLDAGSIRALIESNAHEAAELAGQLTLLLDRASEDAQCLPAARLVTRRLADRLGQALALERLARSRAIRPDAWSPLELAEELEHEAVALAGSRIAIDVHAPDLVPQYWFFDRELVGMALRNAMHNALMYAAAAVTLELRMQDGYLGFGVLDDAGAFPAELLVSRQLPEERAQCKGNALGVHFARVVAASHVHGERRGRLELANRGSGAGGTRFILWLP